MDLLECCLGGIKPGAIGRRSSDRLRLRLRFGLKFRFLRCLGYAGDSGMAAAKSGTVGKLVGSTEKGSFDPTARRSRVPGCSNAAAIAASSVTTFAWPVANKFWCVPQTHSAAAWLGTASTMSKKPNCAWNTFSFRVGVFGKVQKLRSWGLFSGLCGSDRRRGQTVRKTAGE